MKIVDYIKDKINRHNSTDKVLEPLIEQKVPNTIEAEKLIADYITNFFAFDYDPYLEDNQVDNNINTLTKDNLVYHLRDYPWISKLITQEFNKQGILIPTSLILQHIGKSEEFNRNRHDFELSVVKSHMKKLIAEGNWLMPDGIHAFSAPKYPEIDVTFRDSIIEDMSQKHIDYDIIQEALEGYSDIWRKEAMLLAYNTLFYPVEPGQTPPEPVDEQHKIDWIRYREYQYYQTHKYYVDKYGTQTEAMKMTEKEAEQLGQSLLPQNKERLDYIIKWLNHAPTILEYDSKLF